jgi:hypothetical protein
VFAIEIELESHVNWVDLDMSCNVSKPRWAATFSLILHGNQNPLQIDLNLWRWHWHLVPCVLFTVLQFPRSLLERTMFFRRRRFFQQLEEPNLKASSMEPSIQGYEFWPGRVLHLPPMLLSVAAFPTVTTLKCNPFFCMSHIILHQHVCMLNMLQNAQTM